MPGFESSILNFYIFVWIFFVLVFFFLNQSKTGSKPQSCWFAYIYLFICVGGAGSYVPQVELEAAI